MRGQGSPARSYPQSPEKNQRHSTSAFTFASKPCMLRLAGLAAFSFLPVPQQHRGTQPIHSPQQLSNRSPSCAAARESLDQRDRPSAGCRLENGTPLVGGRRRRRLSRNDGYRLCVSRWSRAFGRRARARLAAPPPNKRRGAARAPMRSLDTGGTCGGLPLVTRSNGSSDLRVGPARRAAARRRREGPGRRRRGEGPGTPGGAASPGPLPWSGSPGRLTGRATELSPAFDRCGPSRRRRNSLKRVS